MDSLFILLLIGFVIGLELRDFCVFNDGMIVYNDCFEMEYELEYGIIMMYYYVLSIKIDSATSIPVSRVNFDPTGIRSCQISKLGCDSFGVSSPRTVTAAIPIKNENEMKYEGGALVPQTETQIQSRYETSHLTDDTGPDEFNDLEYIFDGILHEDGYNCDINNAFKHWCNKSFNCNYDCNMYYESAGMSVFDFLIFIFSPALVYHVAYECVLFLFLFVIESAINCLRKRSVQSKLLRNNWKVYYSVIFELTFNFIDIFFLIF